MFKTTLLVFWYVFLLHSHISIAGITPGSGIVGSLHDIRDYVATNGGISDEEGRVCAYCHTPHHAINDPDADYLPLWSHEMTVESFQDYTSATLDAVIFDPLAGPTRLCMSCHDGVVAIDSYYDRTGTSTLTGGDNFGEIGVALNGNLMNDHPIGFDFVAVAAIDPEINIPETPIDAINPNLATISELLLDLGNGTMLMTCASCHDVHNGPSVMEQHFLYASQIDSEMCRICHRK